MVVTWAYNAGSNTATASGAGTTNFAALVAADTAGGWGVYTADATGTQIVCAGKIIVGDDSNATILADSGKQVVIDPSVIGSNGEWWIYVVDHASVVFGTLNDETTKRVSAGMSFKDNVTAYYHTMILSRQYSDSHIYLYGCSFEGSGATDASVSGDRVWGCRFTGRAYLTFNTGWAVAYTSSVFDYMIDGVYGMDCGIGDNHTIQRVTSKCSSSHFYFRGNNVTVSNSECFGGSNIATVDTGGSSNYYLVNVNSDAWSLSVSGTWTGKLYRQYTFDLTTDPSASVVLKDKNGDTVFSVTSNAVTGAIATQTVSRGYYTQATGNTLQDYAPFTLTITKDGKLTYINSNITLTEATSWNIQLLSNVYETFAPSSQVLEAGTATGSYTNLIHDDGVYMEVDEQVASDPCLRLQLIFENVVSPEILEVHVNGRYDGSDTNIVQVALYNYTTAAWDTLGAMDNDPVDEEYTFTASGTLANYVSGGTVKARFNRVPTSGGNPTYTLYLDQVLLATAQTAVLTGNATESDVLAGKTFYNTDATAKKTGRLEFPQPTRPRIKRVPNPVDDDLLMAAGFFIVRNRQLKRELANKTR